MDELSRRRVALKADNGDSSETTPLEALELARQYVEENPEVTSLIVIVEPPAGSAESVHVVFADCTYAAANYFLDLTKRILLDR